MYKRMIKIGQESKVATTGKHMYLVKAKYVPYSLAKDWTFLRPQSIYRLNDFPHTVFVLRTYIVTHIYITMYVAKL